MVYRSPKVRDYHDDVAIDFPSVDSVIDGMRESFFGEPSPAAELRADIELTAEEAFWGATVPLDVMLRRICPGCGGRGETWEQGCEACEGEGDVPARHPLTLRIPAGVRPGACFRFSLTPPGVSTTRVEVRIIVRTGGQQGSNAVVE